MNDTVYLIKNIEEYGKLMAYCIDHDISVWRTYWDERVKGTIGYHIDWKQKRCFYCRIGYWKCENIDNKVYNVVEPIFSFDKYGKVELTHQHEDKGE